MTAIPPVAPPSVGGPSLRWITWIVQAVIALLLAFGASLVATRVGQLLLSGAAAGVLAASAVGLALWTGDRAPHDPQGRSTQYPS